MMLLRAIDTDTPLPCASYMCVSYGTEATSTNPISAYLVGFLGMEKKGVLMEVGGIRGGKTTENMGFMFENFSISRLCIYHVFLLPFYV